MFYVRVALNTALLGARAFGGRVFLFVSLLARAVAVQLDQLGIVHVAPESTLDGQKSYLSSIFISSSQSEF